MPMLFTAGRILFILIFLFSGASKLLDLPATTAMIAAKVTVPSALAGLAAQAEATTGMQTPQLLAIIFAAIEIIAALMIVFSFGTRIAALALILLTAVATYYFHDFWNQVDPQRTENMIHVLKNLSIIGGLIMLFALGSWRPVSVREEDFYPRRDEVLREEPLPR